MSDTSTPTPEQMIDTRETFLDVLFRSTDTLALSLARARTTEAEQVRQEYSKIVERDRSLVAQAVAALTKTIACYNWLATDRGSYEYSDDNFHREFGNALREINEAIEPLQKLAADWSFCPLDIESIAEARTDYKTKAEAATKGFARLKEENEALRAEKDREQQELEQTISLLKDHRSWAVTEVARLISEMQKSANMLDEGSPPYRILYDAIVSSPYSMSKIVQEGGK